MKLILGKNRKVVLKNKSKKSTRLNLFLLFTVLYLSEINYSLNLFDTRYLPSIQFLNLRTYYPYMKNILFIFFSILFLPVFGQYNQLDINGLKHGKWRKYRDTKGEKLRFEGQFDHGVPTDTFFYYYSARKVEYKNVYKETTGNCYSYQYDEKGNLMAEGWYVNQEKDSTWTFYGLQQNLISREDYKNGTLNGSVLIYYQNGKLAEKLEYVDGIKHGAWIQKYEDGKQKVKGTYINGSLHGEVIYYNFEGRPFYKGKYNKGLRTGDWYTFEKGKLIKKETFKKGEVIKEEEY